MCGRYFVNSTRKLLWFEITEMLVAVLKNLLCYHYNFRHTFVPYGRSQENWIGTERKKE